MDYITLSQDEIDDTIVGYYKAQEMEAFCHQLNISRFEIMLETMAGGDFKKQITENLTVTRSRLAEVMSILIATQKQLPSEERIKASLARLKVKEEAPASKK